MEFENEEFNVIVPDYLINENEAGTENEAASEENEAGTENEAASEENEAGTENEAASEVIEAEENEAASEENEAEAEATDYSSILQEMNSRLENIEANTVDYTEGINGLLANVYFIDFVAFTVFVFLMLGLVIKFFKQFF